MGLFLWEEPSIILLLSQFFLSALPGDPINSLFLPLFFLNQVSAPQLDSKYVLAHITVIPMVSDTMVQKF